jgi:hydroxymethylpyrimidine/phosphomethylpyrimidine kinase
MTVLTALPVQNTMGVRRCYGLPLVAIEEQLASIVEDIPPDAIKIGMVFQADIIEVIHDYLSKHAHGVPIVLDPVLVATSGDILLEPTATASLKAKLLPLATLVTPNMAEAASLTDLAVTNKETIQRAAEKLLSMGCKAVLLKGGHLEGAYAEDLLMTQAGETIWLSEDRVDTPHTHGTGCTLSAAIAAELAKGNTLAESCQRAKHYLHGALIAGRFMQIGKGRGPVHHFYQLWE